jgi:hypothetical protein
MLCIIFLFKIVLQAIKSAAIVSSLTNIPKECTVLIATHDGSFHCDESLAVGMLKLLPQYSNSENTFVVRTRNPDILKV